MKKIFTLSISIFLFSFIANAQWVPAGSGMDAYVWGSAVYNNELYACGNFEHADGNPALAIARWNGLSWSDVGGGFQQGASSYVVNSMIVFNNELIAGGYVDSVAGIAIHKVAKWNGTNWSPVGMDCPIGTVNCFAIHNGELYAGGSGSGAGNHGVAKWNGSNWIALDNGSGNINVFSLASYNGELYAAGTISNIDGVSVNLIAKWNGTTWSDVSGGLTGGFIHVVRALAVFNSKLYVGGNFTMAGSVAVNHIASWDGSVWADVNGGIGGSTAIVQSFLPAANKLFVGGTYWTVNSVTANRAAYWDGTSWTVLGTDLSAGARTQAIYNGELYSLGEQAGSGQNYTAKWTGGTFTGINKNILNRISTYPNPVTNELKIDNSEFRIKEVEICDAFGKNVRHIEINSISSIISIDVSEIANGVYFISSNNSLVKQRFVVQR